MDEGPAPMLTNLYIENVDTKALVDAYLAIERAEAQGIYDEEQKRRLGPLHRGLQQACDEALAKAGGEQFART